MDIQTCKLISNEVTAILETEAPDIVDRDGNTVKPCIMDQNQNMKPWAKKFEERMSRMMHKMLQKCDSDNGEDEQANAQDVAEVLKNEPDKPDRDTNPGPS